MTMNKIRLAVQHLAFVVLTYGGYFRISLGSYVPCLSCPFIFSCSGRCYLMALQRGLGRLFMPLVSGVGAEAVGQFWDNLIFLLKGLLIFSILVIALGKTWCGWICPFGLVQDWVSRLRRFLRIRESELLKKHRERLSYIKYVVLLYMVTFPMMVSLGWIPNQFMLAFCRICPANALMPLFVGDTNFMSFDFSTRMAIGFSIALLTISAGMLVGMFFRDRFFCVFCPMLALMNLYRRLYLLRLVKEPQACQGCGNCRRNCTLENDVIYQEREKKYVYSSNCMSCFKCSETCAGDRSLLVKLGPLKLFSSSRRYAARL
jgi:polyferredoxin